MQSTSGMKRFLCASALFLTISAPRAMDVTDDLESVVIGRPKVQSHSSVLERFSPQVISMEDGPSLPKTPKPGSFASFPIDGHAHTYTVTLRGAYDHPTSTGISSDINVITVTLPEAATPLGPNPGRLTLWQRGDSLVLSRTGTNRCFEVHTDTEWRLAKYEQRSRRMITTVAVQLQPIATPGDRCSP